ncbi:BTAD domain-containing putative transcriptional regulator [Actinoplanes sp. G11-F43]|uniref:AfsR/SARP family transcriptional regulator n=1 Tax=Actinoplanes sp. G11-F43 TaxID=3424130 RepID=UPI003D34CE34
MHPEPITFAVLGPLRGWHGDTEIDPGPPKQQALLSLLLLRSGHPVPLHEILDVLWGENPPDTALTVVYRHVGALRRLLEPELPARGSSRWLTRGAGGYRLDVAADDLTRFRDLRQQAAGAAEKGRPDTAAELLTRALARWRGPVGTGLPAEIRSHPVFATVDNERLTAIKTAAEYASTAGPEIAARVLELVRQAATGHPLDEALQARLMLLLAGTGHQAEALRVYQSVRTALADELGLDPGAELRAAHRRVLQPDSVPPAAPGPAPAAPMTRPAQLPAGLSVFAGRHHELDRLRELSDGPAPATLVTIGGMAGVGKTTLGVQWAHRIADRYPDGQLHLDLRGFHPDGVLTSAGALRVLLEALGTPPGGVPSGLDARSALFRSLLADRRVLILLDNARDSAHVLPLLPGAPGCLTVVTSRHQLYDLAVSHGATAVSLDPLPAGEATALLSRRIGGGRTEREPEAAAEIVELCGRLPLTLAMVSARAAMNPGFTLSAIAAELRRDRDGPDPFSGFTGETERSDARSVFDWSYRVLSPEAARLFRLLALHPGPDCSRTTAEVLAGTPGAELRRSLTELLRASLITEPAPGRYGCHDLLRAYGAALARSAPDTGPARSRALDHYLHSAHAALSLLYGDRAPFRLDPAVDGASPLTFTGPADAAAWIDTELQVLLAVVERPGDGDTGRQRWQLAVLLDPHLDRTGRWAAQRRIQTAARTAALRLGDKHALACTERALGFAEGRSDRYPEADRHLDHAVALFTEIGDQGGQARTHRLIAFLANRRGEHHRALDHYRVAAELYLSIGQVTGRAAVHNEAGWTYILLGDYAKALDECRPAIDHHRAAGDLNGEAAAWDSLGYAQHHLGAYDEARESFGNALRIYREVYDRYLEADTLSHLGDTEQAAGHPAAASAAWQQALTILDDLAHPDATALRTKLTTLDRSL